MMLNSLFSNLVFQLVFCGILAQVLETTSSGKLNYYKQEVVFGFTKTKKKKKKEIKNPVLVWEEGAKARLLQPD